VTTPASAPAATARPIALTVAFWLWVVDAVRGLITGIVTIVMAPAALAGEPEDVQRFATGFLIAFAVLGMILSLLHLYFAFPMRAGRNWARVVLTVLAAFTVLAVLTAIASATWYDWIGVALVVVAAVLMYLPASNAYFRARRRSAVAAV